MAIEWNPSRGATLGVEWEVQLIDSETKLLRQEAGKLLDELPVAADTGEHPRIRHELMQSTLELVTGICSTVSEAKDDLTATITELQRMAAEHGILLACAGTHPVSDWRDATMAPIQRYAELVEQMQWLARRIQTFGVHVHVGIRDGRKAMPIVNALAAYLPHFLAITASSPFWCGYDTGLASSRSVTFGALPTAGPPHRLTDWKQFEDYMDTLLRAGTIRSIKEVWWDIRPHPDFGTVEIRMSDGVPTLREVGMVAALSQCLVQLFDAQLDRGYTLPCPSSWVVRDNKWRATRYGLDAIVITDEAGATAPLRDELFELLAQLEPVASRLGCQDELSVVSEVLEHGASYERQRAVYARTGDLISVVDALVTEFAEDRFCTHGDGGHGRIEQGNDLLADLDAFLAEHEAELIEFRRDLHAHPELAFNEHRTTRRVALRLAAAGLRPVILPKGTGMLVDIGSEQVPYTERPVVALRADMDALPMTDDKDVPYRSTVPNVCHACGHDVHTTVLLGTGLFLAEQAAAGVLPGRVRLVFQPAEEAAGGALDVLAAGGIASVGRIFALHCDPRLDAGQLGVRSGAITAACDRIEVRVAGPGGHTARPHLTADLVYALGKILTEVPAALSRRVDPRSSLSLVWGRVSAGTVANAIPDEGVAEGTVRCLDDEAWHSAPDLLKGLIDSVAQSYGVNAELSYQRYVPPTVNDQASAAMISAAALDVLGAGSVVQTPQSLGGEDFAWYLESIPGALARLGTRVPGSATSLDIHQPTFDVDERAIGVGIRVMSATAITALWDDGAIVAQPLPGVTGA